MAGWRRRLCSQLLGSNLLAYSPLPTLQGHQSSFYPSSFPPFARCSALVASKVGLQSSTMVTLATLGAISSPSSILVVQPRCRPNSLLKTSGFPFSARCADLVPPNFGLQSSSMGSLGAISSPSSILVVQPRCRPNSLLKTRLTEALRLVEALHLRSHGQSAEGNPSTHSHLKAPGLQGNDGADWWPSGVPDSSPWVVVGQAEGSSRQASRSSASTFFGKGAVENVAAHVQAADRTAGPIEAVFVNAGLTGSQQRNLEQAWGKSVVDRVGLIIDIFGARAATREAKLQVELASLAYQRSRLVRVRSAEGGGGRKGFGPQGQWEVVSARGKGGGGGAQGFMSGEGESELQLQKRRLGERQHRLRRMLEDVRRTRGLHRARRQRMSSGWDGKGSSLPVVAVVGYTNAGKSSLVSALSGSSQYCDDSLFATLDPKLRGVRLPSGGRVLLSDTVGFISDLPIELVEAFHATLQEVVSADLLLHVIDGSAPDQNYQRSAVLDVLQSLGVYQQEGSSHQGDSLHGGSVRGRGGSRVAGLWKANGRGGAAREDVEISSWKESLPPIIEVWNKADLWQRDVPVIKENGRVHCGSQGSQWSEPPSWDEVVLENAMQIQQDLRIEHFSEEDASCVVTSTKDGLGLDILLERIEDALWRRGYWQ